MVMTITIEEMSIKWADLLHEAHIRIISLEKANRQLKADNESLGAECQALKDQLSEAYQAGLEAQYQRIVEGG
jgi:hypothetical protein